jgi:hypothetical protein
MSREIQEGLARRRAAPDPRDERLEIRLTREELTLFTRAASRRKTKVSTFVRDAAISVADGSAAAGRAGATDGVPPLAPPMPGAAPDAAAQAARAELEQILVELRPLGVNVNQIAFALNGIANSGGGVSTTELYRIRQMQDVHAEVVRRLVDYMGGQYSRGARDRRTQETGGGS